MDNRINLAELTNDMPQSGIREIFDKTQKYDTIYNLGIGEPDFATPEPIATAVQNGLGNGINSYTQTIGRADLRAELAKKLSAQNNIDADPDSELLVTPGAMGALFLCMNVLCDPGDEVLIPSPYWPNYEGHLISTGARVIDVPTYKAEGFTPRIKDIADAVTDDTVGMILNTPTNPTGAVFSSEKLGEIGEILENNDLWCILDETYEDLVYENATHHSLASNTNRFNQCITIHSFSKSYAMTGWRLGYASGPEHIISAMSDMQEHTIASAAEPSQIAAKAALDNEDVVHEIHDIFAERRNLILNRLNSMSNIDPSVPTGAFYVFADISSMGLSSHDFVEYLLKEVQVAAIPGSVFGDAGEGFVRLSYAADKSTINKAMDLMEQAINSYG